MALESFYGGKQGVSPVIKAKFKYINTSDPAYIKRLANPTGILSQEEAWILNAYFNSNNYKKGDNFTWTAENIIPFTMDECLKRVNYTEVWYGELCIIDTDNKLNPNNGKLFKRTLKQADNRYMGTEDTLYAEYIGQIVGPSGAIPNFDFGSLDAERKKAVGQMNTYATDGFSPDYPADNTYWDYRYPRNPDGNITNNAPSDYEDIKVLDSGNNTNSANIQMVPGKKDLTGSNIDDNNFNDKIRYTWCNVRRRLEDKEDDAWIYLGFEIPYTVYNVFNTEENYTYGERQGEYVFIDQTPTGHPFYKEYVFHIPRGARGIGPESIFIVGKDGRTKPSPLYNFDAIKYLQGENTSNIKDIHGNLVQRDNYYIAENTPQRNPNTNNEKTYWVAKWRLYNPKKTLNENTDVVYQYLGSYRDIVDITLDTTKDKDISGTVTVNYSNGTSAIFTKALTWITSASVDTDKNSQTYGSIKIIFNNNKVSDIDKNLHLIKNIVYTDEDGSFTFQHSGNIDIRPDGTIEYIKNIAIDIDKNSNDYGKITGTTNKRNIKNIGTLPFIKSTNFNPSTGILTFNYSGIGDIQTTGTISYIAKMRFSSDGTLQYQLNNSNNWENINNDTTSNPEILKIKDIKQITINQTTGHLIATYRDNSQVDLGLVKGNPTIGIVYTLKQDNNNTPYVDVAAVLDDLSDGVQESANTYIEPTGKIVVNGSDKTGGFVAALIERENQIGLFYYDATGWHFAGFTTGSSSGLRYVTIESGNVLYPSDGAPNPAIILQDNFAETVSESIILPWDNQIS